MPAFVRALFIKSSTEVELSYTTRHECPAKNMFSCILCIFSMLTRTTLMGHFCPTGHFCPVESLLFWSTPYSYRLIHQTASIC